MLFTEKDLLNVFKQNVDNKGWIYFVGNPESNAKFIIDFMKANKEEISEAELDVLATKNTIADLGYEFDSHDYTDHSGRNAHWASYREGWKNAYRKAIKEYGSK